MPPVFKFRQAGWRKSPVVQRQFIFAEKTGSDAVLHNVEYPAIKKHVRHGKTPDIKKTLNTCEKNVNRPQDFNARRVIFCS
jgi:hypothetical protein